MDHLSQAGIFVLEELRDAEEEGGSFVCRKPFAGVEEEGDLGQEDTTSAGLDRGAVEKASWKKKKKGGQSAGGGHVCKCGQGMDGWHERN